MLKDIKLMIKEVKDEYENRKEPFLEPFEPVNNFFVRITPLKVLKWWNKFLYKHDSKIYYLEKKWKPLRNKFFGVSRWYTYNISGIFRHRIPQCWAYIKLAWYDYDWDYGYLIDLIKFKISRMEKRIRKDSHLKNSEKYCDQMKIALECLENYNRFIATNKIYEQLDLLFPEYSRKKDREDFFSSGKREVYLNKHGKKVVIYKYEHNSQFENSPEGYKKEYSRLLHFFNDLEVAYLRVFFQIIKPGEYSTKEMKEIRDFNSKLLESYDFDIHEVDYDSEEYKDYESKMKNIHYGLLNWWD